MPNSALIYPNPVKEEAKFEFELLQSETISLKLIDMNGKSIKTFIDAETKDAGKQYEILNFNNIPAGNYVIVLSNEFGCQNIKVSIL
jgi:hypothetical protein